MSMDSGSGRKRISNSEIDSVLEEGRSQNMMGFVIMIVGILIILGSFSSESPVPILFVGAFIACGGNYMRTRARSHVKKEAGVFVIQEALDQIFDDVTYEARKALNLPGLYETPMGFPFKFNIATSDDYIEATYKGLKIRMGDVRLVYKTVSTDAGGTEHNHEKTVFQGPWMVCDFGKRLNADMILAEGGRARDTVKTDNDRFNRKFSITATDPQDVFYILTPHVMEYILDMDQHAQGNTYMNFSREGRMVLAINTGRPMFEVKKLNTSAEEMRQKLVSEVGYLAGLLDELRKVDTLYSE